MKTKIVVVGVVLAVALVPGVVQADEDELPEECSGDPMNIEELEEQYDADAVGISGRTDSLPSRSDVDAIYLKTDASESDEFYITIFHTDLGNADNNIMINITSANMVSQMNNIEWAEEDGAKITLSDPGRNASFKLHDDSFEDNICLQISAYDPKEPAYDWKFTISQNNRNQWYPAPQASTPTPTPTPAPTVTATDGATTASPTDDGSSSGDSIQDSDGDGVIDSEDYAPQDPDVQQKSDLQNTSGGSGAGFGVGVTVATMLLATVLALRQT